jgi:para-nitrobenzyl esterase
MSWISTLLSAIQNNRDSSFVYSRKLTGTLLLIAFSVVTSFGQKKQPYYQITPVVRTENGFIEGAQEEQCFVFKGIPYEAPRTGAARFMAPRVHSDWKDTLKCLTFGSESAQPGSNEHPLRGSEDGLYLNVYTPSLSTKAKLPVLVWVHGGSMVSGSGNGMNGHAFADKDSIVTITINYRLGVFGFMYLGDLGPQYKTSGNNGLLDLIQALKWVRANIRRFGGDPSSVTVMGESAGAKLSSALIVAPKAKGLYSGIILESGGFQCIRDTVTAKLIRKRVMEQLGITNPKDLLEQPTDKLIAAERAVLGGAKGTNYFGPVMDGRIITGNPYRYVQKDGRNIVHYLIGANQHESKIFMDMDSRLYHPDAKVIYDWFGINYPYCLSDIAKARQRLGPGKHADSLAVASVLSEYMYQMHASRMALTLSKAGRSIWFYRFQYPPANHGSELNYIWYDPAKGHLKPEAAAFAHKIHQYWVQFIRSGRPGMVDNINWGPFTTSSQNVMLLNKSFSLQKNKNLFNNPRQPSACFLLK